ncbi:Transcription elongation factor, GreA/GreB, C-term [Alkalithermobacter thermoalcaliphilus JW-YL-7 = DSM 7308]|uniref:GreA/GreB family elongation factor n=1 Tax=Alkalithermobacter thermoalcaliphilus JW-YL-7 = DSM 7308 TaxID=1121328 RepID=A0A150FQ98_CLOPD|nr:GreA/GreB family elongation factor [[Clostridium] paradoxum JW-YL-7 = DSM 7308]SHK62331.1 Transcription elongation factor, GreA/GreB, C-term [[Clostridium] paradoxum JW-YL-7 = DSM 7308]
MIQKGAIDNSIDPEIAILNILKEYFANRIGVGCSVQLYDYKYDENLNFEIVDTASANFMENKISEDSPLGKALIGKKAGDEVVVTVPDGKERYKIICWSRKKSE